MQTRDIILNDIKASLSLSKPLLSQATAAETQKGELSPALNSARSELYPSDNLKQNSINEGLSNARKNKQADDAFFVSGFNSPPVCQELVGDISHNKSIEGSSQLDKSFKC